MNYSGEELSYFIFTFLLVNNQRNVGRDVYINMLDPKIVNNDDDVLVTINRKNEPLKKLEAINNISLLSIVAHGNGNTLYFGKNKIVSSQAYKDDNSILINDFLNKKNVTSLFLNSCFSLKSEKGTLSREIVLSTLNSAVLYRGLKDNCFPENNWYIILAKRGIQLGEIVKLINLNLELRSTDLPKYIAIGNPNIQLSKEEYFSEYCIENENNKLKIKLNKEKHKSSRLGFCKIDFKTTKLDELLVVSSQKVSWVIDFDNNQLLFMSEQGSLPEELYLEFKESIYMKLESEKLQTIAGLQGTISNKVKNFLIDLENQKLGIYKLITDANFYSDIAFKAFSKLKKYQIKEIEYHTVLLNSIISDRQNALSPLSESYIQNYHLVNTSKNEFCPYCSYPVTSKLIKKNDGKSVRKLDYCANCGIVRDYGQNMDNFFINIETEVIGNKLIVKGVLNNLETDISVVGGILTDKEYKFKGEIYNITPGNLREILFEVPLNKVKPINSIKFYFILGNELGIISKPFQGEMI